LPTSSPASASSRNQLVQDLEEFFVSPEELLSAAKASSTEQTADPLVELLVFSLGSEEYALPVPQLREIVMPPPLSEVPRADVTVLGVTMLRGEVVPVFDPRPRLKLPARPAPTGHTRVIIADAGEGPLGLWVDAVAQVLRVRRSALESPPPGLAGEAEALAHLGRRGDKLFGVLDLKTLLAPSTAPR
jgi:purine-binding chemotaxis protein CheW